MGAEHVREKLPPLLRAIKEEGHPILWASDPMHGNGIVTADGVKTRRFDAIMDELEGFFTACWEVGVWPGGVHLEFTGENVTECLGGADDVLEEHLSSSYKTLLDPRLNARQSLDLAFRLAELMQRAPR
jgi:3-deoxy-7-phosphoheptulonate synthase